MREAIAIAIQEHHQETRLNSNFKSPSSNMKKTTQTQTKTLTLTTAQTTASGFNVLPLPPKLRRTSSTPIEATDILNLPPPPTQSPESLLGSGTRFHGSPLVRTESDPIPFLSHNSPPTHLVGGKKSESRSPNSSDTGSESPACKRLKRMSDRIREMKQWFEELIHENDQDCTDEVDGVTKETDEKKNGELRKEEVETVSANREGDSINIRFKCPCGHTYHILLLGQNCYYKLL